MWEIRVMKNDKKSDLMEKIVNLCKRRGFIFPTSEIYGGTRSAWDYGPLGVLLKNNVKKAWWTDIVQKRDDMVGQDAAIIMNPKVWEASGHIGSFHDPLVECKKCHSRFRVDHLPVNNTDYKNKIKLFKKSLDNILNEVELEHFPEIDKLISFVKIATEKVKNDHLDKEEKRIINEMVIDAKGKIEKELNVTKTKIDIHSKLLNDFVNAPKMVGLISKLYLNDDVRCPDCRLKDWDIPKQFNLMFKTFLGPAEDSAHVAYLRPETAQGIFVNFKTILETSRKKLPFGIAQIGKAFRNEITPGNFTFRTREFEQMEIEYFVKPDESEKAHKTWLDMRFDWYKQYGIKEDNLRLRKHEKDELAHYAKDCSDVEYKFPMGWSELEGIANRGDYDLKQHEKFSGKDMKYFDEEKKEKYFPSVIEPSAGADRATLAFLVDAYSENEKGEIFLRLHPKLAPYKVAILPLVKKDEKILKIAKDLHNELKEEWFVSYDETGSVGKRYRKQDEIGTPWCVTVDFDSLKDKSVTIRDRDTMKQERVKISEVKTWVEKKLI